MHCIAGWSNYKFIFKSIWNYENVELFQYFGLQVDLQKNVNRIDKRIFPMKFKHEM